MCSGGRTGPPEIVFQKIRAATLGSAEAGHLVWVSDRLAALLVEAEDGWFLQIGLGPFDVEGLLFPSMESVGVWISDNMPRVWGD